ncbi:MAG: glycosyltransferase [Cytophagales bacterium]
MLLSIIIATKNRESVLTHSIEKSLESIKNHNIEIIIVNDGNEIIHKTPNKQIYYLDNNKNGVSHARNLGAANAKSDYLFFIDDDVWISTNFVIWFLQNRESLICQNFVYNINWHYPQNLIIQLNNTKIGRYLQNVNYHTMWGRMGNKKIVEPRNGFYETYNIGSCSLLIKKKLFLEIGGYDERIIFQGEDIELSNRLNKFNIPIFAVFDTIVYHNHLDRFQINNFLDREFNGYKSEFESIKNGYIENKYQISFLKFKTFNFLVKYESIIRFCFKKIPNHKLFDFISFKILGILSSLQKHKAYQK